MKGRLAQVAMSYDWSRGQGNKQQNNAPITLKNNAAAGYKGTAFERCRCTAHESPWRALLLSLQLILTTCVCALMYM